ncbi:MAG: hypothetical protein H6Q90_587 [Deltaproteobacteria bacterium]|nr:hypothetical protein [Deltaproteobacteria bacterium]
MIAADAATDSEHRDDTERRIVETICQLAKISVLGSDQDIFEAGLSSIQALQLLVELEEAFAVTLPDEAFVQARTVRALERLIRDRQA